MSGQFCVLAYRNKTFRGFVALSSAGRVNLTYDEPYRCSEVSAHSIARAAAKALRGYEFKVQKDGAAS